MTLLQRHLSFRRYKYNCADTQDDGAMGVPITFLDKYCPDQFEILGIDGGDMGTSYGVSANLTQEECNALFREHKGFRRGKLCYRNDDGGFI